MTFKSRRENERAGGKHLLRKLIALVAISAILPLSAQVMTAPQLKYRLADAQAEFKAQQKRFDRADDALKEAEDSLMDLNDDLQDLQKDSAEIQSKLAAADEAGKAKLAAKADALNARINALNGKIAQATAKKQEAQAAAEQQKQAMDKAEELVGQTKKSLEIAEYNSPVAVAERNLDDAKAQKKALADALEAEEDIRDEATAKAAKALKNLEKAQNGIKDLQADAAELQAKLLKTDPAKADKLNGKLADLKAKIAARQTAADQIKAASDELTKVADNASAKYADALKKYEAAEQTVAAAEDAVKNAKVIEKEQQKQADAEAKGIKVAPKAVAKDGLVCPWMPKPENEVTILQGDQKLIVPEAKDGDIADAAAVLPQFDVAMVSGDKEPVEKLQIWKDWSNYIIFNKVTPKDVNQFHGKLVKALQEKGYVFAQVTFPTRIWSTGIFLAKVDLGALGDITVRNEKHYSAKQIAKALQNEDGRFNYAQLHSDLFDLNIKPDLKLNTQLQTAMINGRRVVNADVEVDDKLPIHGAIELNNTGSRQSDSDWRIRATLQHLNLTQNGDSLTFDYLTGGDVADDLNSFSGNYFLPVDDKNHFNLYAGWNSSFADHVLPEISVRGRGFFAGANWTHTIYEDVKQRVEVSLGWYWQRNNNRQDLLGNSFDNGSLVVSMPSVTLGYSSKVFDNYAGRNFASVNVKANRAGIVGASSSSRYIANCGPGVEGDFTVTNIQLARFQRLFAGEDAPGKWTLFAKSNIQLSTDDLPSILREYAGGLNSVRGYEESEIGGDKAITATLELRTPLLESFIPGLRNPDKKFYENHPDHWSMHRLQFLAFTDFGYVSESHRETGADDQGLASIGAGLRLGLTKYAQMSLDYGYPLIKATDDTPDNGRVHLSVQLQF